MLPFVLALRLATLTMPFTTETHDNSWTRLLPAKNWEYKVRRDLLQSHVFDKAFPNECYPTTKRAPDGRPLWTRYEFSVWTQRVRGISQHHDKALPLRLQREVKQLLYEFRKELRELDR